MTAVTLDEGNPLPEGFQNGISGENERMHFDLRITAGATKKPKAPLRFAIRSSPATVNSTETKFNEIRKTDTETKFSEIGKSR
jgi:hypothetical protein